jgi:hypothetical protein
LFQQELFGQTLLKEVGIDKLKSSGGRLECEIEELRLWEDNAGQKSIIYYASAEKKEAPEVQTLYRYGPVHLPLSS